MNKEEYREEVIQQLREQNHRLEAIESSIYCGICLIIVILLLILVAIFWQNCAIGHIESMIEILRNVNDPLNPLYNIYETVDAIYRWVR